MTIRNFDITICKIRGVSVCPTFEQKVKHGRSVVTAVLFVYGRKARLPVELDLPTVSNLDSLEFDSLLKKRCEAFINLSCCREKAAQNIKHSQAKQKSIMMQSERLKTSKSEIKC